MLVMLGLPLSAHEKAEKAVAITETSAQSTANSHLTVNFNLLRWATLTPDLGIEWRINQNIGITVNGSWTYWRHNGSEKRYALREIAPELRWYMGREHRWYVGAMYKAGAFNYKFSETGKQGNINGGGITGGYQMKLSKNLALDFSLGVGYLHTNYDKYNVIDGVHVRQRQEKKDYWGPTALGLSLKWTIF